MTVNRVKKPVLIAAATTAAVLVLGAGGGAAYAVHYSDLALPGTTVAGHDVSGLNRTEIEESLQSVVDATTVSVTVNGQTAEAALPALGVTLDSAATADAVLARNASVWDRFSALFNSSDIAPTVTKDQAAIDAFTAEVSALAGTPAVESAVTADEEGHFVATAGTPGKAVDADVLGKTIDSAIASLSVQSVTLDVIDEEPKISLEQAQTAADNANELAAVEVSVTDGVDTYEPTPAEKAAWITIPQEDGTLGEPAIDRDKVAAWVAQSAEAAKVEPEAGVDNVDEAGNVLVEAREGREGLTVNNADAVVTAIVDGVTQKAPVEAEFNFDREKLPNTQRPALPGAANYAYPAAEGEKWVDVDLTNNTVTAYEGLTPVYGPIKVNHGSPGHETVTGIYSIYLKYTAQDMGCTPDWPYCVRGVPWVMYFHGSYALHGAPWVDVFGRGSVGGSHGCVNLPVDAARWLHDWTEMGTRVASHY